MRKCILKVAAIVIAALFAVSLPSQAQSRKGVSILGDSYSTFENMVEPAGNALWYFKKPDPKLTDVNDVKQTWWHIFISENGYRLVQNNSFSGSTICNTVTMVPTIPTVRL